MSQFISYTAWFNIFALALNLAADPYLQENVRFRPRWAETGEVNLLSKEGRQILIIDVFDRIEEERIMSYVLIPWQEMYRQKDAEGPVFDFPESSLYTVTPFAVIYMIQSRESGKKNMKIAGKVSEAADHLFNYEQTQTVISSLDGYTTASGLQVMTLTEYPYYVEVHAATSGSRHSPGKEFFNEFSAKMIRLVMVPESGPSTSSWFAPEEPPFEPGLIGIEEELLQLFSDAVKSCINDPGQENRRKVYEDTRAEILKILAGKDLDCDMIPEFCDDLIKRLIFYEPAGPVAFDPGDPFPDHVPKMTPDELRDFMPGIGADLGKIPDPELSNLPALIKLFKKFKKAARKNPGVWTEGNMVLGAKPDEYIPSKEELLLAETGKRIRSISTNESSGKIKAVMKKHKLKKKKIKYLDFTFVHMDVMGSGRYFYVEEIEKVKLKLY